MAEILKNHDKINQKYKRYQKFLKRFDNEPRLPFSPMIAIKHDYVGQDTSQVWIGKKSGQNINDYILICLPAGKDIVYKNGSSTNNFKIAAATATTCTIIILSDLGSRQQGQSAIYRTVSRDSISVLAAYIQNFERFLTNRNLQKDFPYTFKFTPAKQGQPERIFILATAHLRDNKSNAHNKPGKYGIQVSSTAYNQDDNYVELAAINGDICCQSPPRTNQQEVDN